MSLVGWSLNVGRMSGSSGTRPGSRSAILASLHPRTDRRTALTMAAGESVSNHHDSPFSSTASLADGIDHPILRMEATIAATGPAALHHHESSLVATLRLASAKALLSCSDVNQCSHQATAHILIASLCAWKAGGKCAIRPVVYVENKIR